MPLTRAHVLRQIAYQEADGVHTYCACFTCGRPSRGGKCATCWREVLAHLADYELAVADPDDEC